MKFIWIALIIFILIFAIGVIRSDTELKKYYEGSEALQWLKINKNPAALASNRFDSTTEAIEFVEKLYSAGAEFVKIPAKSIKNNDRTSQDEGGPYVDALVVKLPSDQTKRKAVFDICAKELIREGSDEPEEEIRDNMIFLWWD